jgi:hypothetical protein
MPDYDNDRILISFDATQVDAKYGVWLAGIEASIGLGELDPQPYWDLATLRTVVSKKLVNCVFAQAEVERRDGIEYFSYTAIKLLEDFDITKFVDAIQTAKVLLDCDARTGHNHGVKFRLTDVSHWPELYGTITII